MLSTAAIAFMLSTTQPEFVPAQYSHCCLSLVFTEQDRSLPPAAPKKSNAYVPPSGDLGQFTYFKFPAWDRPGWCKPGQPTFPNPGAGHADPPPFTCIPVTPLPAPVLLGAAGLAGAFLLRNRFKG